MICLMEDILDETAKHSLPSGFELHHTTSLTSANILVRVNTHALVVQI